MKFREMYTTKFMLIALTSAVVIDAVLTTLVIYQQHEQNTVTDQASIRADAPMSGTRIPAGSDIAATPNAIAQADPVTTPHPVDAPIGSILPAPGSPQPASPPSAATPPVPALPQITPTTPIKSLKPGAPPGF